jgi:biotin carboxylase
VQGVGHAKKQRTPIKNSVKEALQEMVNQEMEIKLEGMETNHHDLMETRMTSQASTPTLDAQHLTRAPEEPRQEQ